MAEKTERNLRSDLHSMNSNSLESIIIEAQTELKKRDAVKVAEAEVKKILRKYNVLLSDLYINTADEKPSQKTQLQSAKQKAGHRALVAPKYRNPATPQTWSGRGRAPSWVSEICRERNISLVEFKASKDFKV